MEETGQAILSVLEIRQRFLRQRGITDIRYILTGAERAALVRTAKSEYDGSAEQVVLQERDAAQAAKVAFKGGVSHFVRKQLRKRWHRHLQRVCGSKQIWELLAFTGEFDVATLADALKNKTLGEDEEAEALAPEKKLRHALQQAKAEARAAFNEGGASQPAGTRQ